MKKLDYRVLLTIIALFSFNLISETLEEIIVIEKKTSTLNGWSQNLSIASLNSDDLNKLEAQHP